MENGFQMTLDLLGQETSQEPIVGASDSLARTSVSPEKQSDSMEIAAVCFSQLLDLSETQIGRAHV